MFQHRKFKKLIAGSSLSAFPIGGRILALVIAAHIVLATHLIRAQIPPPPPAATIYTNLPNVDRGYGVIGRDDGLSILIGTNVCFFFGDTVLTQANIYGSSWVVNTMYHTTNDNGDLGVIGGYNWMTNGQSPLQFIPYTPDETNWVATNANKYVYAIWPDGQFYSPGDSNQYITINKEIEESGGNLVDIGEGLAICPTNPITGQATRVLSRPGNAQPYLLWDSNSLGDWGDMCCTMSNYVYSYLVDGDSYGYLYVARALLLGNPPAFLTPANWQYWNGSTWSTTMPTSTSASILNGTGDGTIDWNAFLTNGSGGRGCYLYTYMSWVNNQIETRASSDLVHWSSPTLQYTAPTNWLPGQFPYFAHAHKCLEKNNGQTIYITWSLPDTNLSAPENMPMIRAQFPMVSPTFSGLTASRSIAYGTPYVALGGTVSATGAYPAPGETVTVIINGNAQPTPISDSAGDFFINYNASALPASGTPYPVTYIYPGDGALYPVTNANTLLVVTQATASVAVSSSENPSFYGENVDFQATLPNAATGTIFFLTNSVLFNSCTLQNGLGTSASTTLLPIGTNTVSVEYAGDNNYLGSTNILPGGQVVSSQPTPSITMSGSGTARISFVANPYEPYLVQTATNLSGPWQVLSTNAAAGNGLWLFIDPNATNPLQFYEILPEP